MRNDDLPSAQDLVERDPSLTWKSTGTRVPSSAPPRRPQSSPPETGTEPPGEGEQDTSPEPGAVPSAPGAPASAGEQPAPDTAARPVEESPTPEAGPAPVRDAEPRPNSPHPEAQGGPGPYGPGSPAAPNATFGAPPTGAPVPLFPPPHADGPPPQPPVQPTPDAEEPSQPAIPGNQGARSFLLGEAPAPAAPPSPETSADLTSERLMRSRTGVPTSPGRRLLHRLTGGRLNLGESPKEEWRRSLRAAASTHLRSHRRVAVLCIKGGVGKTTVSFVLGSLLSELRGDRVIAVDANTDQGTLAGRMRTETAKTIQDLLQAAPDLRGYFDVRGFTSQAASRLEVLASNEDPAVTDALSADDYRRVTDILQEHYSIAISDCGTGILHDVIRGEGGVLDRTDQLIVVSNTSINGARKAGETMDWLEENGYKQLVRESISVINMVGERGRGHGQIDMAQMLAHFRSRSRAVVQVPVDDHLITDDRIDLDLLSPRTRDAFLELAALVGQRFSDRPSD